MESFFDRVLTIPVGDPDDTRRRRLLNVLLFGVFAAGLLGVIVILGVFLLSKEALTRPGVQLILPTAWGVMLGAGLIYAVNRRSGRVAAFLFLLLLTVAVSFSDTPQEVAAGRSLFFFAFPIAVSSLVLLPVASFIFAGISGAIIAGVALSASLTPNVPAIIGFFLLALVSWLSSRGLEQAIGELRAINLNLDRLVGERTQALVDSIARERAEAGQKQAILDSITDGVIVFDKTRKSILANPAIEGMLETPLTEIVDRSFEDLAHSPIFSARDRGLMQAMMDSKGQPSSFRVEWGKKTLSVSAAPVLDTKNQEIGTVAVFRDVTRETELERMKSAFIAIVSHELRTPLNAIMGFAEMIKEAVYGPANEEQVAASERILVNGRHMLAMVGDLLDQAQIEAGKLRITTEMFEPAELLRNVEEVMSQIVAEKGLTLTTRIDPSLPALLKGDTHRLQQILMNLVNNSIKFTESGGIRIQMLLSDSKHWALEVRDTGSGIPPEDLEHIFDAFFQVDYTTTRVRGGFGLGLSIVKQLVHLMKGQIEVQSTPGAGTAFAIALPLID